jgi:hypothetical protein
LVSQPAAVSLVLGSSPILETTTLLPLLSLLSLLSLVSWR